MKCPNCGTESDGRFCPSCGASLRKANCSNCGGDLVPGARFCTQCGQAVGAAGTGGGAVARGARRGPAGAASADDVHGGSNLAWYIAAGVLGLIIIVLLVPMLRGGGDSTPAGAVPLGQGAAPGSPPPLTGTPREQADRLFNRIMAAREQGDLESARFFAPMGIQAYQAAEPLDHDGLYHLATIHVVAGDNEAAIQVAERILGANPNHLLGLAVAAEASEQAGDVDAARTYHRRFLAAYDTEIARGLVEYQDHSRILPEYRAAAQRAVGG